MLGSSSKLGRPRTARPAETSAERPPMPDDDTTDKGAASAAERKRAFGAWLKAKMDERHLTPSDLVELMNRPTYNSGTVSNWRSGTYAPSELGAWIIADALALPAPEVMRAAGFHEMARRVERAAAAGVQPPPRDPILERAAGLGAPGRTRRIIDNYRTALDAVRRAAGLELAQLERELAAEAEHADAATTWSTWVRLGAVDAGIAVADFVRLSDGAIDEETADAWAAGTETAEPTAAILAARILTHLGAHRDDLDALAAAGHHGMVAIVRTVQAARATEIDEDPAPDGGARVS